MGALACWTVHYEEALRSEPEFLLERIQTAAQSIVGRLKTIRRGDPTTHGNEHRALCLALSDLRVLRIAFSRSKRRFAVVPVS